MLKHWNDGKHYFGVEVLKVETSDQLEAQSVGKIQSERHDIQL